MRKLQVLYGVLLSLAVSTSAFALPIFPVDTVTIADVKGDIIAWAGPLIGLSLALLAYRYVRRVVR